MKQTIFHIALWVFSGSLYLCGNMDLGQLTFSKAHSGLPVTSSTPVRLKDIDAVNPLFIFK